LDFNTTDGESEYKRGRALSAECMMISYIDLGIVCFVSNYGIYWCRSVQSNRLFFRRSVKKFLNLWTLSKFFLINLIEWN